jgi:hypothetical protein
MSSSIRKIGPLDVPIDNDPLVGEGGWAVLGNTGILTPHVIPGIGATGFSAGFTVNACIFNDAFVLTMQGVLMSYDAAVAWDCAGMIGASGARADQAINSATPGSPSTPGTAASGAVTWKQLTFNGGSVAVTTGLSDNIAGTEYATFTFGDVVDITTLTPTVDATNNQKGSYIYYLRATATTLGLHEGSFPQAAASQRASLAAISASDLGLQVISGFNTGLTLSTVAGAGVGTGWNDWAGNGAYFFAKVTCDRPVMNVMMVGDSIPTGAFTGTSGTAGYDASYFNTACRKASTKAMPIMPINLSYPGATGTQSATRALRFIANVQMPDVIVLQPSRNSGYDYTVLETVEAVALAAGRKIVWVTPFPDYQSVGPIASWTTARNAILAKVTNANISVMDPAPSLGVYGTDISDPAAAYYNEANQVHPNGPGQAIPRDQLAALLTSYAEQARASAA